VSHIIGHGRYKGETYPEGGGSGGGGAIVQTAYTEVPQDGTPRTNATTDFADLLTVNITTTGGNTISVQASISADLQPTDGITPPTTATAILYRLVIDGHQHMEGGNFSVLFPSNPTVYQVAATGAIVMEPDFNIGGGPHTVTLQWACKDSGFTATVDPGSVLNECATLLVEEIAA